MYLEQEYQEAEDFACKQCTYDVMTLIVIQIIWAVIVRIKSMHNTQNNFFYRF